MRKSDEFLGFFSFFFSHVFCAWKGKKDDFSQQLFSFFFFFFFFLSSSFVL
jgi:hypothetical protein